jgi:adenosylhomocysteinase
MRAKGLGASVIVTEVEPIKALEAVMDGFKVMTMEDAAPIGDIFVTVTGCKDVITASSFKKMKAGAICCNAGHFDCEVSVEQLSQIAVESFEARTNLTGYRMVDGRCIYVIAEGKLVNLAAGDGHPAEIMDMSFAIQALSARYLVKSRGKLPPSIVIVPEQIDNYVAVKKLESLGVTIDVLTEEQKAYLGL